MEIKGIDVSAWQGNIDWVKVALSGIKFAILKAGGSDCGFYTAKKFKQNVEGAQNAGIDIGAYYFVGKRCKSAEAGLADAMRFQNIIKPYKFTYPVYIDFEAPDRSNKKGNTDAANTFCLYMQNLGYYVGIYASDISGFKERLNFPETLHYDKWVARYGSKPTYAKPYGIWQYSSKGNVPGIRGKCDMDISYNDYPTIIKAHHLNGF